MVGADDRLFWEKAFARRPATALDAAAIRAKPEAAAERRNTWVDRLFRGQTSATSAEDRIVVLRDGVEIDEIPIARLASETAIGRHPDAQLQLEAGKLGLFHAVIRKREGALSLEAMETDYGTLLDRKRVPNGQPMCLRDGSLVDVPGYQLRFHLTAATRGACLDTAEALDEIPSHFYVPPPKASPVLARLVEERGGIAPWSGGATTLKVADIVQETKDATTFRLVGEEPMLFSYRPGQFVTLLLDIDGREVERSYSLSSSPSRPHALEITVKRAPGGLVSNWLCDHVKLGQRLRVKGPSGKFSCTDHPASKMLFIAAGSGMAPLMSMIRWIGDTVADVDLCVLASFKSPEDILFRNELELISARQSRLRVGVTLTAAWGGRTEAWRSHTGRIDAAMIQALAPDVRQRRVFMCGPDAFAAEVRRILHELGFDLASLHSESFGSGRAGRGGKGGSRALRLIGQRHKVHFTKSDIHVETDETVTLLQLAEAHGIEIDYACRAGSCAECEVDFTGDVIEKAEFDKLGRRKTSGKAYACCSVAKSDLTVAV
jgi:ferredoxin-NADP reductase